MPLWDLFASYKPPDNKLTLPALQDFKHEIPQEYLPCRVYRPCHPESIHYNPSRYTVQADGFIVHRPHAATKAKEDFMAECLETQKQEGQASEDEQRGEAPAREDSRGTPEGDPMSSETRINPFHGCPERGS